MKVVVNRCFGGFSLSPKGIFHYLKLAGKECYFYEQIKYSYKDGEDLYEKKPLEEIGGMFSPYTSTIDLGNSFNKWPNKNPGYFYHRHLQRNDPLLVQMVEELKSEANGRCAKLEIVEIPDDIEWHIDEYDGMESVHENHRSW